MVQAARSGKQNIAEGNQAAATSSETEIKLTNVAKASLEELLDDYENYLTLIHQAMSMLHSLLATMQKRFVSEGGVKERMHRARTGYRQQQDSHLAELESAVPAL